MIIESPLKGDYEENRKYARACLRDSLMRGESPFASHLLYDQEGVLDDTNPGERTLGIEAGLVWGEKADGAAFYVDRGFSEGMIRGLENAIRINKVIGNFQIEIRRLGNGNGKDPSVSPND